MRTENIGRHPNSLKNLVRKPGQQADITRKISETARKKRDVAFSALWLQVELAGASEMTGSEMATAVGIGKCRALRLKKWAKNQGKI